MLILLRRSAVRCFYFHILQKQARNDPGLALPQQAPLYNYLQSVIGEQLLLLESSEHQDSVKQLLCQLLPSLTSDVPLPETHLHQSIKNISFL